MTARRELPLVNIRDWCKNSFEVVNQLRINTDNTHHRYDVILHRIKGSGGLPDIRLDALSYRDHFRLGL